MRILSILFPILLYLNIFQLEGYDVIRFLKWIFKNLFTRKLPEKRKLIYTTKTKLLLVLSLLIIFATSFVLFKIMNNFYIASLLFLIELSQFYLALIIARIIFYPFELLIIQIYITKTRKKINAFNKLKIIGITGSYAKTSVKELLYQLIKNKYKTLRTPESYNTILGISKVIDYELDESYDYFICEMAAYHNGDIKKLCNMVPPKYGILTGITSQHLERFGSLEKITKTKFELYDFVSDKNNIVLNLNDTNILNEVNVRSILTTNGYLNISDIAFSKVGSSFDLIYKKKKYRLRTNLFGFSNIENLSGAITLALLIGVDINEILKKIANLIPTPHRFSLKNFNKSTIVDNTFSSNDESFNEMVKTVKQLKGSKILVTPGLVELGKDEDLINESIGKLINNVFDRIILIGNNHRTRSIARHLKNNFEFIPDTRKLYFEKINELSQSYDWIFLENDITENY